jgi:phosphopantothenoylcysteine decarboxylase/phosphopantothenate--cysteine ligase
MGFALAEAARDRGAEVTLVKAATTAEVPGGVRIVEVESTADLLAAMERECPAQDAVIQAAAVADYRPAEQADRKIKKQAGEEMVIRLVENPDVARTIGEKKRPGQILVGFAAETDHVQKNAVSKLKKKNLDMIVANDVTVPGAGFNVDTNIATLITAQGSEEQPMQTKRQLAEVILDRIMTLRA